MVQKKSQFVFTNGLFGSLRERGVKGRRVERNGYPSPCLDIFKISKGERSNYPFLLFGCFKNYDGNKINLSLFENLFFLI